jgi:hypothetical protein
VLWDHRDAFSGEDEPPAAISVPWQAATCMVTDAFGAERVECPGDGQIELPVSATPLFVSAT